VLLRAGMRTGWASGHRGGTAQARSKGLGVYRLGQQR
jgi:hypothetical protein